MKTLIKLTLALYIALNSHLYSGLNKGIVVDLYPTHYAVGLEVVGDFGMFVQDVNE